MKKQLQSLRKKITIRFVSLRNRKKVRRKNEIVSNMFLALSGHYVVVSEEGVE